MQGVRRTSKPTFILRGYIIIFITFMQAVYSYIPGTSNIGSVYTVAASLYLQIMLQGMLIPMLNVLYFYISTSRGMCAVHNMAVCCGSLISYFPSLLLSYFLNDFEMVAVSPVITGTTFVLRSTCVEFLLLLLLFRFCEAYFCTSCLHDILLRYDTETDHCNHLFADFISIFCTECVGVF